jgi:hypothetical protein
MYIIPNEAYEQQHDAHPKKIRSAILDFGKNGNNKKSAVSRHVDHSEGWCIISDKKWLLKFVFISEDLAQLTDQMDHMYIITFSAVSQPNGQRLIHKRYRDCSKYVGFLILFGRRVWCELVCGGGSKLISLFMDLSILHTFVGLSLVEKLLLRLCRK